MPIILDSRLRWNDQIDCGKDFSVAMLLRNDIMEKETIPLPSPFVKRGKLNMMGKGTRTGIKNEF